MHTSKPINFCWLIQYVRNGFKLTKSLYVQVVTVVVVVVVVVVVILVIVVVVGTRRGVVFVVSPMMPSYADVRGDVSFNEKTPGQ